MKTSLIGVFMRRAWLAVKHAGTKVAQCAVRLARIRVSYSWPAAIFQIAFIVPALYWWKIIPPPGYAVAALAVAAAVMAVRGQRFTKIEELTWILLAFVFFGIELRAITYDRENAIQSEEARRTVENNHFQSIADRLSQSLRESQTEFAETLGTVTGGDSFCYFVLANDGMIPTIVHVGNYPLYDVEARFVDNSIPFVPTPDLMQRSMLKIGDLTTQTAIFLSGAKIPIGANGYNLNIFFGARNGFWTENFKAQRMGGKWVAAIRVLKPRLKHKKDLVIFEKLDKEFPRNKHGLIDWK
jgi:hypothetical protein